MVFVFRNGKTGEFPDKVSTGRWYEIDNISTKESSPLLQAILACSQTQKGGSLFLSAIESGKPTMIREVATGLEEFFPQSKVGPRFSIRTQVASCDTYHYLGSRSSLEMLIIFCVHVQLF